MKHRPALDGVRGLAILAVLLGHHGVLPGGHLGVSVFFVLSGYLITTLLLREDDQTGRIDLGAFYLRRAARLLPALAVVLGFFLLIHVTFDQVTPQLVIGLVAAAFYCSNLLWSFAPGIATTQLQWPWSLSAEEQFYALWPAVLLALGRRRATVFAAVGIVTVEVWRSWLIDTFHPNVFRVYFSPASRSDALLAGCLLALLPARRLPRWVSGSGAVGLAGALFFAHPTVSGLTWGLPVVALTGTIVLADAAQVGTWTATALSWRPLTHIGRIAYGLYLWDVAVMQPERLVFGARPPMVVQAATMLALFVCAETSWRYLEQPIIRRAAAVTRARRERSVSPRVVVCEEPAAA